MDAQPLGPNNGSRKGDRASATSATYVYTSSGRGGAGNYSLTDPSTGNRSLEEAQGAISSAPTPSSSSVAPGPSAGNQTRKVIAGKRSPPKQPVWAGRGGAGNLGAAAVVSQSELEKQKQIEEAARKEARQEAEKEVDMMLKKPESAYLGK